MTVKSKKETEKTLEAKIADSSHNVVKIGKRYTCVVCNNSFSKPDISFQEWLQTSCTPTPTTTRPSQVDNNAIHIGNLSIHHTHKIATHKGLLYCTKCGSRAGSCLKNLAHPCEPPGEYGKISLKAILSDKLPPNLDSWPIDV